MSAALLATSAGAVCAFWLFLLSSPPPSSPTLDSASLSPSLPLFLSSSVFSFLSPAVPCLPSLFSSPFFPSLSLLGILSAVRFSLRSWVLGGLPVAWGSSPPPPPPPLLSPRGALQGYTALPDLACWFSQVSLALFAAPGRVWRFFHEALRPRLGKAVLTLCYSQHCATFLLLVVRSRSCMG